MFNYEEIKVIGRIATDVIMLKSKSGKSFATLSVAVNKRIVADGEKKKSVVWYTLIFNNKQIDMAKKYCRIGELLFVSGIPQINAWLNDGEAQAKLQIIVKDIVFLSHKAKETSTETESTESFE